MNGITHLIFFFTVIGQQLVDYSSEYSIVKSFFGKMGTAIGITKPPPKKGAYSALLYSQS